MDNEKRLELNPVLCQFISQNIEVSSLDNIMHEIIKYYTKSLRAFYKKLALVDEVEDEIETGGNSPMAISPRKQNTFTS